jgi:hypothetical protein
MMLMAINGINCYTVAELNYLGELPCQ